jgi:hypothetical protein
LFQLPSGKWYFFHESSQIYDRQFKHHTEQVKTTGLGCPCGKSAPIAKAVASWRGV